MDIYVYKIEHWGSRECKIRKEREWILNLRLHWHLQLHLFVYCIEKTKRHEILDLFDAHWNSCLVGFRGMRWKYISFPIPSRPRQRYRGYNKRPKCKNEWALTRSCLSAEPSTQSVTYSLILSSAFLFIF